MIISLFVFKNLRNEHNMSLINYKILYIFVQYFKLILVIIFKVKSLRVIISENP